AEAHPSPALRAALPDLKAVACDLLLHEHATRAASGDAAARIQTATERLSQLPLPTSPPQRVGDLPRPSAAPSGTGSALASPRPSGTHPLVGARHPTSGGSSGDAGTRAMERGRRR